MLERLLDEPELGKSVREFHILSDLADIGYWPSFFRRLEEVIVAGSLPHMHTLSFCSLLSWTQGGGCLSPGHLGKPSADFWTNLRKNCPRLRGLILRGISDDIDKPYISNCGVFEIQDVSILILNFRNYDGFSGAEKFFKNISSLSANLRILDLSGLMTRSSTGFGIVHGTIVSPLLKLTLPKLVSLSVADVTLGMPTESMAFFERHHTLVHLDIYNDGWFPGLVSQNLLPNLRHLKSRFNDVRSLAPILHRLTSLTVRDSVNAQFPYLLRLPNGLPDLRSLRVQMPEKFHSGERNIPEGGLWFETLNGDLYETEHSNAGWDGYIHSILRGAPNIEEIAFDTDITIARLVPHLAFNLSKLRRLYLKTTKPIDIGILTSDSKYLANVCRRLDLVVQIRYGNFPYTAARISRNESGMVSSVVIGNGYGMQIGSEDEAFPFYY